MRSFVGTLSVTLLLVLSLAVSAPARELGPEALSRPFQGYDGCFLLYSLTKDRLVLEYNPGQRCGVRIPANSTFKVPLSIMAFDQGIIDANTVFKWDGKPNPDLPDWNKDQTPATWQMYSVVWVSQQLTPKLGIDRINRYLAEFSYGNRDFSGDPGKNNGLTHAWLSSSLKISAEEQLNFLKNMARGNLPVSPAAVAATRRLMYQGKLAGGAEYFGKTGSGWQGRSEDGSNKGKFRDGWYLGFVETKQESFAFVVNISDRHPAPAATAYGGQVAKGIALGILNDYLEK